MSQFPPVIDNFLGKGDKSKGFYETQNDPSKLLISTNRYERPTLRAGSLKFEWPLGVEGVTISGQPTLAEHRYIGDNDIVLDVTHLDDQRIVLSGMFPGLTGTQNMEDLMRVIRAPQPKPGKVLVLPRIVFSNELIVAVADYNFDHPEDDRTGSWTYTITFRRVATGRKTSSPRVARSPVNPNPGKKGKKRGRSERVFTVHAGGNTLRAAAKLVYGNANRWQEIYNKNTKTLKKYGPLYSISTKRLPLGLKLEY